MRGLRPETLRDLDTISRFSRKCQALDQYLREKGRAPAAVKVAEEYLESGAGLRRMAETALSLEEALDKVLFDLGLSVVH